MTPLETAGLVTLALALVKVVDKLVDRLFSKQAPTNLLSFDPHSAEAITEILRSSKTVEGIVTKTDGNGRPLIYR